MFNINSLLLLLNKKQSDITILYKIMNVTNYLFR